MYEVDKDYFKDKAKSQIDEGLTTLITDEGLSADEIHGMLVAAVEELYQYFNKPALVSRDLLNKLQNKNKSEKESPFKMLPNETVFYTGDCLLDFRNCALDAVSKKSSELALDDKVDADKFISSYDNNLVSSFNELTSGLARVPSKGSERSVSGEAYKLVTDVIKNEFDIDIRCYKIGEDLTGANGLNLYNKDLVYLWDKGLIDAILDHAENKVGKLYGSAILKVKKLSHYKRNHFIPYLKDEDGSVFGDTIFDLVSFVEKWMNIHLLNVLRSERVVQSQYQQRTDGYALELHDTEEILNVIDQAIEEVERYA